MRLTRALGCHCHEALGIEAAKLHHDTRNPRYPGLAVVELRLDFRALIVQKDEIVRGYRKKEA